MARFIRLRSALVAMFAVLGACAAPTSAPPENLSSDQLKVLYAQTAATIEARGGLRTERQPQDAPITIASLTRNFERIAFFSEFTRNGRMLVDRPRPITLTRWEEPIQMGVIFGPSVSASQQRRDLADVRSLISRFRRATGLDIRYVPSGDINFLVLVLEREEQEVVADLIQNSDNFPPDVALGLRNSPPGLLCSADLFSYGDGSRRIAFAAALIKSEHRNVMRTSCFHEELAQSLGLVNDNFRVRPSVFNDDEEFAYLTLHDEILLTMLYDPRLRPGMTARQARPLLPQIARDAARAAGLRLADS